MTSGDPLNLYSTKSRLRPVDVRKDLDDIANLIETCFSPTMDEDGRAYLRQLRKSAEDARRLSWAVGLAEENIIPISGFVWVEDNQLIGNLTLIPLQKQGKTVHLIANVAVLPQFRRRGIGYHLTQAAIDHVREKKNGTIWLQVRDDNQAAEQLYRGLGFEERSRRTTWHNLTGDPEPDHSSDIEITSCWPSDWNTQVSLLEQIYPQSVSWNLPVNFQKFKPSFLSQFSSLIMGEYHRNWAVRKKGQLLGTLTWEAARTWADNLWVGCKPQDQEIVLNHLLPHAMSVLNRTQPQAINYPAGEAESIFLRYGFHKHLTLIWMELNLNHMDNAHIIAAA
jgi:ribosomal protein S18 acetylase RimI-like enzyme